MQQRLNKTIAFAFLPFTVIVQVRSKLLYKDMGQLMIETST